MDELEGGTGEQGGMGEATPASEPGMDGAEAGQNGGQVDWNRKMEEMRRSMTEQYERQIGAHQTEAQQYKQQLYQLAQLIQSKPEVLRMLTGQGGPQQQQPVDLLHVGAARQDRREPVGDRQQRITRAARTPVCGRSTCG